MAHPTKKYPPTLAFGILVAVIIFAFRSYIPLRENIDRWFYSALIKAEYKLRNPPKAINDILLVLVDNDTLNNMLSRWPYPRADFAKVTDNLENAGAKIVAFDFVFLGRSTPLDDAALEAALKNHDNVILACSVNERGTLDFCALPDSLAKAKDIPFGLITKLQDKDGMVRSALTYLISKKDYKKGFLSWEMQILKAVEAVDLASLSTENERITFKNASGKIWTIPVDAATKSFLINFRAHTSDFNRLSFHNVLEGKFDPSMVKGKIVMVGLASSVLADVLNTPLGWLPGVTINANSFLTLYSRDFLKDIPVVFEFFIIIACVAIAIFLVSALKARTAYLLIGAEIAIFYLISYLALMAGCAWNYFDLPFIVIVSAFAAKKMLDLT